MNLKSTLESNLLAMYEPTMPHEVNGALIVFKKDVKKTGFRKRIIGHKEPVLWTTQAVFELIRQIEEEAQS